MACLSLAFWYDIAVYIVVLIAVVALLHLLIMVLGGGPSPFWPLRNPLTMPAPSGFVGFLAAAVGIIIWAVIVIFIIWLVFTLVSCLLGSGGVRLPRF